MPAERAKRQSRRFLFNRYSNFRFSNRPPGPVGRIGRLTTASVPSGRCGGPANDWTVWRQRQLVSPRCYCRDGRLPRRWAINPARRDGHLPDSGEPTGWAVGRSGGADLATWPGWWQQDEGGRVVQSSEPNPPLLSACRRDGPSSCQLIVMR
ncbi:unnamed protein product [Protopolystoma xenopodis]|uniref:Uncharacterized protein n=1 Tax=Protopolystoma xenopodis TaxID=117903 RepID=A0A448XBD9_9PLAT|nr:unnamed protein product [Protopolystoma xenopodis]